MHYGIIAAGEGSRLAQEGVALPKPLVRLQGEPMIGRLIRLFVQEGAESVSVVVNEHMTEVREYLENYRSQMPREVPLNVKVKTTPSSMHTFFELSEMMRGKGRFIATTVDTIFRPEDLRAYASAFAEAGPQTDGMMGMTRYIDDEKPLYIETSPEGRILAFRDSPWPGAEFISAGVYGLDQKSLPVLERCLRQGVARMRNFQRALVEEGLSLQGFPMGKVMDIDHASDIEKAEEFLAG